MRQEIFYTFLCSLYVIYVFLCIPAFLALNVIAGFRIFLLQKIKVLMGVFSTEINACSYACFFI